MKKRKLLLSLFCSLIFIVIIEYQKKTIYLTPEVTGYIYDSVTKKPLSNLSGHVGFFLPDNNTPNIKLDIDGRFTIKPIIESYYFIRPNVRKYSYIPPQIYIYLPNYQGKILDYSQFSWKQIPSESRGYSHFKKINIGIIYLDPEKP